MTKHTVAQIGLNNRLLFAAIRSTALVGFFAFAINLPLLRAQSLQKQQASKAALPSFEAVSIKTAGGTEPTRLGIGAADASRWNASNVTLKMLICEAYGLDDFQVLGGPDWIQGELFDVDAKVSDATAAQLQRMGLDERNRALDFMLQSMLADRFKLRLKRNTKKEHVFTLQVAEGGPKFKQASGDNTQGQTSLSNGLIILTMQAAPVRRLCAILSLDLAEPVIDNTGLTGKYDFSLQYAPLTSRPDPSSPDPGRNSIFKALREELGLKVESAEIPVEIVTINHIEDPTPN